MHTGPHIKRNGLVFGYDTGENPSSDFNYKSKKRRHFKGKPVNNQLNYGDEFNSWTKARNSGSYPTIDIKTAKGPFKGTKADRISLPSDGSYPRIYQNFTPTTTSTHTFSIWLKGETDGQGCFIGCFRNGPWSGRSYFTTSITTEWKHYSFDVNPADLTPHQMYIGSHNSHGGKVFLMYGAQLEVGTVASPFNVSSRSTSQSLIDLTKTINIDVSNVSFDSNGQLTFDGTDDRFDNIPGIGITDYSQPFTMECVFRVPTSGTWANNRNSNIFSIAGSYAGQYGIYKYGTDGIGFQIRDASTGSYPSSTGYAKGIYHHVVATFNGGSGMNLYINGSWKSSSSTSFSGAPDTTNLYIGGQRAFGGNVGSWFEGEIPVAKYYNKALSAQAIKQNFRAYKNRFNLT